MAGRIPQHFIDQLLNRIDLVDLIDGYVPLKKAGANYKACCPFHGEKTPSFTVSPSKQFYHCFGCGVNGTAISFLMEYDHMQFREAVESLASSAGMEIPEEAQGYQPKQTQVQGIDLYELMNQVNEFYQHKLRHHPSKQEAVEYLKKRGLSGEIAKRFGLGFAPEGWDNLMSEIGATASAQKALLDTGMLSQNDKQRIYDRFRHRIMFPIHDHRGRVVGFGGRVLDQGEPKYLNSPETPIFHKGSELYGLFAARGPIKEADGVLVVEGYMDVVALAQEGINNSVATLGTATTPMHLQRLFRHTPNITFSFDGDRAGRAAAWKALETCLPNLQDGYQVSFLFLPDGEDPDTMVKKVGKDGFNKLIKEAMPLPEFLLSNLQQQADINRLDGRAKLGKLAKPLIEKMPNGVLKTLVLDRLAVLTQVSPQDLIKPTSSPGRPQGGRAKPNTARAVSMTPVRRAVSLLLQYPQHHQQFAGLKDLPSDEVRGLQMVQDMFAACIESPDINTAALLERYRQESYFDTLRQLAQHEHNNLDSLPDEDAIELMVATADKIKSAHQQVKWTQATQELEKLSKLQQAGQLSENERARKLELEVFIRDCYK